MSALGSSDDCYFYFYSSCTKGSDCPFRHCEAALGTETVCSLWREGRCYRANCKFRHMESRINRASIPCYWENQPGGCRKPHCVFMHQKSRLTIHTTTENQDLILPVSNSVTSSPNASKLNEPKEPEKIGIPNTTIENYLNETENKLSPSFPVEPLVVSFEEGEESDSESVSSTPVKCGASEIKCNVSSSKRNLSEKFSNNVEEKDFGIKTLEQIRMEKIHKESEHFYKSDDTSDNNIPIPNIEITRSATFPGGKMFPFAAYDAPIIDPSQGKGKPDFYKPIDISFRSEADNSFNQECYPPKSEFISLSNSSQEITTESDSVRNDSTDIERDLRNRLLKRKANSSYSEKNVPVKKALTLKKGKEEDTLNFKIKTLDEIRRERENKLENFEELSLNQDKVHNQETINSDTFTTKQSTSLIKNETSVCNGKSAGRLKLKRRSRESILNSSILPEITSKQNSKKESQSQLVLHEVQNITENQSHGNIKALNIRRREIENNTSTKVLKLDSNTVTSKNSISPTVPKSVDTTCCADEKPVIKLKRPIIKRRSFETAAVIFSQSTPASELVDAKVDISSSSDINTNESIVHSEKTSVKHEDCAVSSTVSEKDSDNKSTRSNSVDEFDSLFLNEADMNLDDVEDTGVNESEDILSEIEQLLDS